MVYFSFMSVSSITIDVNLILALEVYSYKVCDIDSGNYQRSGILVSMVTIGCKHSYFIRYYY